MEYLVCPQTNTKAMFLLLGVASIHFLWKTVKKSPCLRDIIQTRATKKSRLWWELSKHVLVLLRKKINSFVLSTASTAPNAPQFDAEKAKVGERNLILLHNSLKEICFLTFLKVWIVNILGGAPFRLTCTLCKGCR